MTTHQVNQPIRSSRVLRDAADGAGTPAQGPNGANAPSLAEAVIADGQAASPDPIDALTPDAPQESSLAFAEYMNRSTLVETTRGMHEGIGRPPILPGATYKIKPPQTAHAVYVTINNITLDESGTRVVHPFEIFINSKNMAYFQWILALTRVMSAVFRKGGDIHFLCEELKDVYDPKGGYWRPRVYMRSLVAEIGYIIEYHFRHSGTERRTPTIAPDSVEFMTDAAPSTTLEHYEECESCGETAVVMEAGCRTCRSCLASNCDG